MEVIDPAANLPTLPNGSSEVPATRTSPRFTRIKSAMSHIVRKVKPAHTKDKTDTSNNNNNPQQSPSPSFSPASEYVWVDEVSSNFSTLSFDSTESFKSVIPTTPPRVYAPAGKTPPFSRTLKRMSGDVSTRWLNMLDVKEPLPKHPRVAINARLYTIMTPSKIRNHQVVADVSLSSEDGAEEAGSVVEEIDIAEGLPSLVDDGEEPIRVEFPTLASVSLVFDEATPALDSADEEFLTIASIDVSPFHVVCTCADNEFIRLGRLVSTVDAIPRSSSADEEFLRLSKVGSAVEVVRPSGADKEFYKLSKAFDTVDIPVASSDAEKAFRRLSGVIRTVDVVIPSSADKEFGRLSRVIYPVNVVSSDADREFSRLSGLVSTVSPICSSPSGEEFYRLSKAFYAINMLSTRTDDAPAVTSDDVVGTVEVVEVDSEEPSLAEIDDSLFESDPIFILASAETMEMLASEDSIDSLFDETDNITAMDHPEQLTEVVTNMSSHPEQSLPGPFRASASAPVFRSIKLATLSAGDCACIRSLVPTSPITDTSEGDSGRSASREKELLRKIEELEDRARYVNTL